WAIMEMVARMGVVTGKGLSDLIRERFGVAPTLLVMIFLLVANAATIVAEFAGFAPSAGLLFPVAGDLPRYIAVPIAAILVWFLVIRGSFRIVERVMLALTLVYISYVISAFLAHPQWGQVVRQTFLPTVRPSTAFILIFISVIGTTITPWMAFFQQSNVADKGLHPADLTYERVDTGIGIFMTQIVAFFIIVACGATVFAHHVRVDPSDPSAFNKIAMSLAPFAGHYATV